MTITGSAFGYFGSQAPTSTVVKPSASTRSEPLATGASISKTPSLPLIAGEGAASGAGRDDESAVPACARNTTRTDATGTELVSITFPRTRVPAVAVASSGAAPRLEASAGSFSARSAYGVGRILAAAESAFGAAAFGAAVSAGCSIRAAKPRSLRVQSWTK